VPRVVPSDVVKLADQMFPEMATNPATFQNISPVELPSLAALARLAESVPSDLVVLELGKYAGLLASIAYLRATPDVFSSGKIAPATALRIRGFDANPIALIRAAMAACPDEAPSANTTGLAYVTDPGLRESIRRDISAAHRDLAQGEWKGATVLAGSAIEAVLLWKLQEFERQVPGSLVAAATNLLGNKLTRKPDANPEAWDLHTYTEVAAHLGVLNQDEATLVRLAKNFRNLIHPGRAVRLGENCDRATALGALAAVEAVAR
jgi:hypothetical protein